MTLSEKSTADLRRRLDEVRAEREELHRELNAIEAELHRRAYATSLAVKRLERLGKPENPVAFNELAEERRAEGGAA